MQDLCGLQGIYDLFNCKTPVYSPQKIILWGGVMHQSVLFSIVREKVLKILNGYIYHPLVLEHIDRYIVEPGLGEDPGVLGSIKLGMMELEGN